MADSKIEIKDSMDAKEVFKDNIININGTDYIELKDNVDSANSITINGKKFEPVVIEESPKFKLVFRKDKDTTNLKETKNECQSSVDKDCVYIDIYPLLVEHFGEENIDGVLKNFIGVEYSSKNTGESKLVLGPNDFDTMLKEFEDLVSATFTNQRQALGFNTTADRIFNRAFRDLLW